jgi:hypothetical protein
MASNAEIERRFSPNTTMRCKIILSVMKLRAYHAYSKELNDQGNLKQGAADDDEGLTCSLNAQNMFLLTSLDRLQIHNELLELHQ